MARSQPGLTAQLGVLPNDFPEHQHSERPLCDRDGLSQIETTKQPWLNTDKTGTLS